MSIKIRWIHILNEIYILQVCLNDSIIIDIKNAVLGTEVAIH